jgi:hypothetical protein
MARLAQERRTHLQHAFRCGSMRVVTYRTIFTDGLVVMYERPAFLHMAGVAGFIHAIAFHEFGTHGAMRIMAIRTTHLSFGNRMMRSTVDLRTLFLVAGKANLGLGSFVAHVIVRIVDRVT